MSRSRKEPLRALTEEGHNLLREIARSQSEAASHVARAKMLLAVAAGTSYGEAAQVAGRKSKDAVSQLVSRFNQEGLAALAPRHSGGAPVVYGVQERERILQEARWQPDPGQDGTATWSLSTLQRRLRQAADGLPQVSTYTIWATLHNASLSWQQSRTWCDTGQVKRQRQSGVVTVTDPDTEAKNVADAAGVG
jgi:transposase